MSENPKTLQLNPLDWQTLIIGNINRLGAFVGQLQAPPNELQMKEIDDHIAHTGKMFYGWRLSIPQPAPQSDVVAQNVGAAPVAAKPNGAAEPQVTPIPKKRGRPAKVQAVTQQ